MGLPGDFIAYTAFDRHPMERIETLDAAVRDLRQMDVLAPTLDAISQNLGIITSGILAFGNGYEIDDPSFSGAFIAYPAITIGSQTANIGGVETGQLTFGLRSSDGAGIFASGAAVLDHFGVTFTGLDYFERFVATNGGAERTYEMGTAVAAGGTVPYAYSTFYDSQAGSNLQTNGDFESGNVTTGWSAADSGTPAWSADTASPYAGTYAAKFASTDDADSNLQTNGGFESGTASSWTEGGTSTHGVNAISPHTGTYAESSLATANQTFTLTTNLGGTPRMAVTAGNLYNFTMWSITASGSWYSTFTYAIKWYTATSGGSLISTDTQSITPGSASWNRDSHQFTAPATAAGAEIVITVTRNASAGSITLYLDDISFGLAQSGTLTTNLGGTPRMAVTAGNAYQFSIYSKASNASATWTYLRALIKWYTATSGGSLISTDTVTLSPGSGYINNARTLTAPATAVGAEIVIDLLRGASGQTTANLYFDNVVFQAVAVNLGFRYQDHAVTLFGGPLSMDEFTGTATAPASGSDDLYWDSSHLLRYFTNQSTNGYVLLGEPKKIATIVNSAAEGDLCSWTIKQNNYSTKGVIFINVWGIGFNNKGSAGTFTLKFKVGSYSITLLNATGLNNNANNRLFYRVRLALYGLGTAATQRIEGNIASSTNVIAADTLTAPGTNSDWWGSPAQDFSAGDVTIKFTGTLSAADANFSVEMAGIMHGSYLFS